jgi:Protein of unknown function (DUF3108)
LVLIRIYPKFAVLVLALITLAVTAQNPPARPAQPHSAAGAPAHQPANTPTQPGSAPVKPPTDTIGATSRVQPPPSTYRFPDGIGFVYSAEWRMWTAGTATLRMEPAGNLQKITSTADAAGVVALLYTVHDRFESYFDPRTYCSQQISKHTEEGFHKKDTNIRFDYAFRKAVLDEKNLKNNQMKHATEDIPGCVVDVLSGIYYVGTLPLQVGATYEFPMNDGGKTLNVRAVVEAREQVKTDAGTYSTLRVRTEDASGEMKKRGTLWIWYTEDANHMPVQMRARAFWGTLTFRLARLEKK